MKTNNDERILKLSKRYIDNLKKIDELNKNITQLRKQINEIKKDNQGVMISVDYLYSNK